MLVYGDTNSTWAARWSRPRRGSRSPTSRPGCGRSTAPCRRRSTGWSPTRSPICCSAPPRWPCGTCEDEGLGEGAVLVGDVMADVALTFGPIADRRSDVLERLGLDPGGFCVATAHRAGNVDDPGRLRLLVEVLARAAGRRARRLPDAPAHPRPAGGDGCSRRPRGARDQGDRSGRLPRHHPPAARLAGRDHGLRGACRRRRSWPRCRA